MPAKKTTILAADDDPQILRLVTRNLQFDGYDVIAVSDGQAALEQIEAHAPDLALLGSMMPRAAYASESHMLQVNINRLRRKIEDDHTQPRYLLTKVGVGYLL